MASHVRTTGIIARSRRDFRMADNGKPDSGRGESQPGPQSLKTMPPQPDGQRRDVWPPYYIEDHTLGTGAYGTVVAATDSRNSRKVAIKKQFTNFSVLDKKDKPVLALRAYRELLLLWTFRGHPNILHLLDAFPLQTEATMATLCLVTNKMDMDLAAALMDNRITPNMRPFIMYSILCGMKFIHSADAIHRDLKPSNIGISFHPNGDVRDVRLLDFGLARKLKVEMSYVVQTLWYRAPEVWLQPGKYTKAIDLWSVGCILAELVSGQVLMRAGTAHGAQLQSIHSYLGEMDKDYEKNIDPSYRDMLAKFKELKRTPIANVSPQATEHEIQLLNSIFLWNPEERLTAAQCLDHPYFSDIVHKQNKGNGRIFSGRNPDQSFEDWDSRPIHFWTEWIDEQIEKIRKDIFITQESPAVLHFENTVTIPQA